MTMIFSMEPRRFAWIVCALTLGCSNGPQRTFDRDSTVPEPDLQQPETTVDSGADTVDSGADTAVDSGADTGSDVARDVAVDGRDVGLTDRADAADARTDGTTDGALRDVTFESSVIGCMTNADCGSEGLYCNASRCESRGFCTPRPDPMTCSGDGGTEDTVCGCDGMSYPTLCELQLAGVRLVAFGRCTRD